ncbi:MAG: hypothetical protein AAF828_13210, partial [Bacteroidota bacterium]
MLEKVPHYSPLYRDFRSIDPTDKQRIIRVYEEKEKAIGQLDPMEYFELTVLYVDALFATGAHRKHLLMVDLVIFTSIDQNIQFLHGEDVYQRMLFRKAASAFRIQDYQSSEHITRELIKMYPGQALYTRLLTANLFRQEKSLLQFGRAAAIFCILAAALVIVLDLLVIENFYPLEHHAMVWLRNDVFLLGVLIFVGCYGFAYYRSWQTTRQFSQQHKN